MKIFIVGATGRVATKLIEQLALVGHVILAGVSSPERVLKCTYVNTLKLNLHDEL